MDYDQGVVIRRRQIAQPEGYFSNTAAAVNNTALDGAVNNNGTFPLVLSGVNALNTTAAGIVIVFLVGNTAGGDVYSVSGSTLGSFTQRANSVVSGGGNNITEFFAISGGALTSEVLTATTSLSTGNFCEVTAFGVKGVKTGTNNGYDINGALPAFGTSGNGLITTSNANDFLIAGFRGAGTTPVTGWTQIVAGSFLSASYLKVTSTQPGTVVPDPISNSGWICDALVSN